MDVTTVMTQNNYQLWMSVIYNLIDMEMPFTIGKGL